jgi:hypothetical protein
MTSMPTPEATLAVVVREYDELLGKVATSFLEVNETGQHKVRQDLNGKIHHTAKTFPTDQSMLCTD